MPLSDDFGAISRGLQQLWKCLLRAIKLLIVGCETIEMTVLPCQHHRARWTANRIRHTRAIKAHTFARDAIDTRR